MKARAKSIFSGFSGIVGKQDRTVGRDKGLNLNLQNRRGDMIISTKTAGTRGGSEARHQRSKVYCTCDQEFKPIPKPKIAYIQAYYRAEHDLDRLTSSDYLTFMTLCLGDVIEKYAFLEFSFFSRYKILNASGTPWTNKRVRLIDITTKRTDGKDLQVFKIDNDKNIMEEIGHKIDTKGSALIKIPVLDNNIFFYADVYSYSDLAYVEEW